MSSQLSILRSGFTFVFFASTLLLSTAVAGASPSATADDASATLTVLQGDVTVVPASSGEPHDGWSGESLFEGDHVLTAVPGGALVTFLDGSELEMDSGTEIELTVLENGTDGGVVRLISQVAGVTVNRVEHLSSDSSYELQTPNATAMVRGTVFLGRVDRDEANGAVVDESISLEQGWVDVRSGDEEERLQPGQRARVHGGHGDLPPGQQKKIDVESGTILTGNESGAQGGRLTEDGETASHGKSRGSNDNSEDSSNQGSAPGASGDPSHAGMQGNSGKGNNNASGTDSGDDSSLDEDSSGGHNSGGGDDSDGGDEGDDDHDSGDDGDDGGNDNSGGGGGGHSGKG